MPKSRRSPEGVPTDHFGAIPFRAHDALRRGEISFQAYGLLSFLVCECWRQEGKAVFTLAGLREASQWNKSVDTLSRALRSLRPTWIDFELRERQRKPFVIQLTGARLLHLLQGGSEEKPTTPQTSTALPQSNPSRNALEHTKTGKSREPHHGKDLRADETRQEPDETDRETENLPSRIGECDDCGHSREVAAWGRFNVCADCGRSRARARFLSDLPVQPPARDGANP